MINDYDNECMISLT